MERLETLMSKSLHWREAVVFALATMRAIIRTTPDKDHEILVGLYCALVRENNQLL